MKSQFPAVPTLDMPPVAVATVPPAPRLPPVSTAGAPPVGAVVVPPAGDVIDVVPPVVPPGPDVVPPVASGEPPTPASSLAPGGVPMPALEMHATKSEQGMIVEPRSRERVSIRANSG